MNIKNIFLLLCISFIANIVADEDPSIAIYRDTCSACHLDSGVGNPSLKVPTIASLPRWYVTDQLRKFRFGERGDHTKDTAGQLMRQNTKSLDDRVIAFLGRYVSNMKATKKKNTLKNADLKKGKTIFTKNCIECHKADGSGDKAKRVPPLNIQPDWYILEQLVKFEKGHRMHSKDFRLNSWGKEAKDIAAYIGTLTAPKKEKEE